jgi:predicted nucleic acid-binding protein
MVFAKLNMLHLLKYLYQQVSFPYAVYKETVEEGLRRGFEDARTLRLFLQHNQWKPTHVKNIPPSLSSEKLDQGEKEAIALALAEKALLLMDEERGREVARQCGVKVRGSLGVFIAAYQNSLITDEDLRFYFAEISSRSDIWINPALCRRLLEQLGI